MNKMHRLLEKRDKLIRICRWYAYILPKKQKNQLKSKIVFKQFKRRKIYSLLCKFQKTKKVYVKWYIQVVPNLQWFNLQFLNFMMVWKHFAFSRKHFSNFKFGFSWVSKMWCDTLSWCWAAGMKWFCSTVV